VFGWSGAKLFAFPFAFLLFSFPIPSVIYSPVVVGLQSFVATINVELLRLGGIPASQAGSLIHLPGGTVGIDEACSGVRSLQSTVMATCFISYLTLRSRLFQSMLLFLGISLAVFGNLVRSLFLSYTANSQGVQAIEKFHDAAGWSILLFTAVGVAGLAFGLARLEKGIRVKTGSVSEHR
jgi:exosortase